MKKYKKAIITGGTNGLGFEMAKILLQNNYAVYIVGRKFDNFSNLKKNYKNKISFFYCDLSEHRHVKELIKSLGKISNVNLLINNVGGVFFDRKENENGFEKSLYLNYICHFLITKSILPNLIKNNLIINVGSNAYKYYNIDIKDLNNNNNYNFWKSYCRAKLLLLYRTFYLGESHKKKINCVYIHPGFLNTNFGNNNNFLFRLFWKILRLFYSFSPKLSAEIIYERIIKTQDYSRLNLKFFYIFNKKKDNNIRLNLNFSNKIYKKTILMIKKNKN
jgi:short-subunit dehydrogenase